MRKILATCSAIAALTFAFAAPAGAAKGEPGNPCWDISGQSDLAQDNTVQDFVNPFTQKQTHLVTYSQTWTAKITNFKNGATDQSKCGGLTYTAFAAPATGFPWAGSPTATPNPMTTTCSSSSTSGAECSWASGESSYSLT